MTIYYWFIVSWNSNRFAIQKVRLKVRLVVHAIIIGFHDGFLSYQQDMIANAANSAVIFRSSYFLVAYITKYSWCNKFEKP